MELFSSKGDRDLWIRLNAEFQIEWEKGLSYFDRSSKTYKPTLQALNPRSMEEALKISKSQCETDESVGKLRFSMEELLTLNRDDLDEILRDNHRKRMTEIFGSRK